MRLIHFIILIIAFPFMNLYSQNVYWAENSTAKIQKSDLDGSNAGTILTSTAGVYGLATDLTNSKIYYTNVITDKIYRSDLDGQNSSVILNNVTNAVDGPRGIAVDGNNSKIYWVEVGSGKLRRADLDGSNATDILSSLNAPVDVALDLVNNKLYWSENGVGNKKIKRSNLDGSSPQDIINTGIDQIGGIDIDGVAGKLYWVDFGTTDKIMQGNLDGSIPTAIISSGLESPRGISVDPDNNSIYWTEVVGNLIGKSAKDGSSPSDIVTSGVSYPIGINNNWSNALPVELISFTAELVEGKVFLNWQTATEINNYGFQVERSEDNGQTYNEIGFVEGNGNSNAPQNYEFIDSAPPVNQLKYRLKQIDTDGGFEYYDQIAEVNNSITSLSENELPTEFNLAQNYPNPFNPSTTIQFSLPETNQVDIKIFNLLGQELNILVSDVFAAGTYQYNYDANGLESGVYFYTMVAGDYKITKKFTLLK
jgi:hypothetical protein